MTQSESKKRKGENRKEVFSQQGKQCQKCSWEPQEEIEEYKLHIHYNSSSKSKDVLCRDCHMSMHSNTAFSHELIGRLTNTLSNNIKHKSDEFSKRVALRVRKDSVDIIEEENKGSAFPDRHARVEGVLQGDHYDSYHVDTDEPYLSMCSCYTHSFGVHRAHNICTHVGANIIRRAIIIAEEEDNEDRALLFVQKMAEKLNEKSKDYIKTKELIEEGVDTLEIEEEYSESWAQRASSQAKKMTKYDKEWKCFGSECKGCEVRLTADGYRCTDAQNKGWGEKFPCPGKLGALILDETREDSLDLDISEGHLFSVARENKHIPADQGEFICTLKMTNNSDSIVFRKLDKTTFTIDKNALIDAIISGSIKTTTVNDIENTLDNKRVVFDSDGIPLETVLKIEKDDTYTVTETMVSEIDVGDMISVLNKSQSEVIIQKANPEEPFSTNSIAVDCSEFRKHVQEGYFKQCYASDIFDIIGTEVTTAYGKKKVGLYTPKESKEDVKELDWNKTHRSWNDPIQGKWSVDASSLDHVVEHLQSKGWAVWVPIDIVENT